MKNTILLLALFMGTALIHAQNDKDLKLNEDTNLIEATYYHDSGAISQKGTFNLAGKLHGEWISYNEEGEKITLGSYENGFKTGKWFFWANDSVKEVEYDNDGIASVNQAKNTSRLAKHN